MTIADRLMARDLAEQLQALTDRVRSGAVPRWAMVVIAPSVATIKHVVDGVNRTHDCVVSACVVNKPHDCIESGCVGEKAGQP
jgi:hypothetical protein